MTVSVAASLWCAAPGFSSESAKDLVRDALLQQSPAERAGCTGVQRSLQDGADATLVVRTAVEMGFNACQVIRCALEKTADSEETAILCEKVIRGAAMAGVQPDVITRCSIEPCDPDAVATLLGELLLEPNYCYFGFRPFAFPDLLPPRPAVSDRSLPQSQASTFRF